MEESRRDKSQGKVEDWEEVEDIDIKISRREAKMGIKNNKLEEGRLWECWIADKLSMDLKWRTKG